MQLCPQDKRQILYPNLKTTSIPVLFLFIILRYSKLYVVAVAMCSLTTRRQCLVYFLYLTSSVTIFFLTKPCGRTTPLEKIPLANTMVFIHQFVIRDKIVLRFHSVLGKLDDGLSHPPICFTFDFFLHNCTSPESRTCEM